ncbi:MAG: hypothetical protein WKG07_44550 [Hymenobacter sp.]
MTADSCTRSRTWASKRCCAPWTTPTAWARRCTGAGCRPAMQHELRATGRRSPAPATGR